MGVEPDVACKLARLFGPPSPDSQNIVELEAGSVARLGNERGPAGAVELAAGVETASLFISIDSDNPTELEESKVARLSIRREFAELELAPPLAGDIRWTRGLTREDNVPIRAEFDCDCTSFAELRECRILAEVEAPFATDVGTR